MLGIGFLERDQNLCHEVAIQATESLVKYQTKQQIKNKVHNQIK